MKSIWKLFTRKAIENNNHFPRLKKYFRDPTLWCLNRESIARGVALGLFVGFIPIMPFQMFLGAILAIFVHANLPITLAVSWINNPFTLLPIAYFTSTVGDWILGGSESKVQFIIRDFAEKLGLPQESVFTSWLLQFGKKYFVGLPFVAIGAALLGYVLVILIWYIVSVFKK